MIPHMCLECRDEDPDRKRGLRVMATPTRCHAHAREVNPAAMTLAERADHARYVRATGVHR